MGLHLRCGWQQWPPGRNEDVGAHSVLLGSEGPPPRDGEDDALQGVDQQARGETAREHGEDLVRASVA